MKQIIKNIVKKLGWELHRINKTPHRIIHEAPRSSITGALNWLCGNEFHIKTVLDVGASNGCWSKSCMNFFPEAQYALFEPQPVHSDALDSFVKSHKNAVIIKEAVGSSPGQTFFDASDPLGGAIAPNDKPGNTIRWD